MWIRMAMLNFQKTNKFLKHSINEQRTEENIREPENESVSNNQTESSKNVTNQERDGATTEEVVKLQGNQKQITDNVIATIDNITLLMPNSVAKSNFSNSFAVVISSVVAPSLS